MRATITSPFPIEAIPRIWSWIQPFKNRVSDDFSPQNLADFVSAMEAKWDTQKTWAITFKDELGGFISFEKFNPWLGSAHIVVKSECQGKRAVGKVFREAVREMFQTGIGKLTFTAPQDTSALASLVTYLGGWREAVLRGHTLREGKPTNMWVFALSKTAFEEKFNGPCDHLGTARSGKLDTRLDILGEKKNPDHNPGISPDAGSPQSAD